MRVVIAPIDDRTMVSFLSFNQPVGTPDAPSSDSAASSEPTPSTEETDASEKWLVRILLVLAFGLAFGIEGMTLVRSFLIEEGDTTEETTDTRPVLQEGDALVPALTPSVRAHRLQVRARSDEWTFTLAARPDSFAEQSYTISFERLTLGNGTKLTTAPSHTWGPSDTASFAASWVLPVGQRPETLTLTASVKNPVDSMTTDTRTVDLGHVPVRMQRE